jgi:shikimate dehydrogenase
LKGEFDVILNATPLGMWPHCNEIPVSEDIIKTAEYIYDSIYNPLATRLLLKAREYGVRADNGLVMLLKQALFAQQIWNDKADYSAFDMSRILPRMRKKLFKHFPVKIVLTGFMGSGKTTIGKRLAKAMGIGFADLDLLIVEENRKPISAIFKDSGEEFFRESEKKCLARIMKEPASLVVSTGGGALISPDNAAIVKENQGFIFYLSTDLATSLKRVGDNQDRPLISGKDREHIEHLYNKRLPIYSSISDFTVDAAGSPDEILSTIIKAIGY